jgi:serine/threonine protein kinase
VSAPDLAPGTVVGGRYTVASRIGRGAMSTTYRAVNGDASEVALKVYDPSVPASTLDSMRRAGEAAAAITSAALAPLDAGVDPESGAPFAVQELSARPSLAQLVELCPLSPADAVALARSLARALGPLHERGVAHGALAPGNVFVGPPPACEVRLSDFAAPRQEEEQDSPAAVATDVAAAARVVSFALTGRLFGSPGPEPDRAWSSVFRRAMHPRPGEAYVSLDELVDSFERAARGEGPPALITPLPPAASLTPTAARPRSRMAAAWKIGLGVVACLVVAVGVAVALKLVKRSPAQSVAPAPPVVTQAPPSASPLASEVPSASEAPSASPSASASASASAVAETPPVPDEPTIPPNDHRHGMLVVDCTPSCDSVFVDGHPIAHADRGTLIDPGVHTFAANLVNHTSKVQAVRVRQGQVKRLHVAF